MHATRCSVLLVVLLTGACATSSPEQTPQANAELVCVKETPTGSNRPQLRCRPRDDMYRTQQSGKAMTEHMTRTRAQTPMVD